MKNIKTWKQFESVFDEPFDMDQAQKIKDKERKVKIAFTKFGVGSDEYETLFSELSTMRQKYDKYKKDQYNGKLPEPN